MKTFWLGHVIGDCELCHKPIKDYFIDGKTYAGTWLIMCQSCHSANGPGLGLGLGQRYCHFQTNWVLEPTEGTT